MIVLNYRETSMMNVSNYRGGAYVTNALNYKGTCVTQNLPHVMSQFKDERCTHGKM